MLIFDTWVWMDPVGVDGLGGGLSVGLVWKSAKAVDRDGSCDTGHACGAEAWRCAGA